MTKDNEGSLKRKQQNTTLPRFTFCEESKHCLLYLCISITLYYLYLHILVYL